MNLLNLKNFLGMEQTNKMFLEINYTRSFKIDSSVDYKRLVKSCKIDFEINDNEDIFFVYGKDHMKIDNEISFKNYINNINENEKKLFVYKFIIPDKKKVENKKILLKEIEELKKENKNLEKNKKNIRNEISNLEIKEKELSDKITDK